MTASKTLFTILSSGLLLLGTACSSMKQPEQPTSWEKTKEKNISNAQLQKIASAYLNDIIRGLQKGDCALFNKHLVREAQVTPEKFKAFTHAFNTENGSLEKIDYLGRLERGPINVCIWSVRFSYPKARAEALKKAGVKTNGFMPDQLYRLYLGHVDGQWRIFNFLTMD